MMEYITDRRPFRIIWSNRFKLEHSNSILRTEFGVQSGIPQYSPRQGDRLG
jgi:hypothetical protein